MTIWLPEIDGRAGPRYLAIADRLGEDLARGRLVPGQQLPTHRELAARLGLTVGTVSRAYAEAEHRGLVRGEVGRGTFVCDLDDPGDLHDVPPNGNAGAPIDLALNLSLSADDPDLAGALRSLLERGDLAGLLAYQPLAGSRRHRQAGADWIARHGLRVAAQQVVITAGAQHAITVALSALCKPGDTVLTEALTYPGLKTAAQLLGLALSPVAIDGEGLVPAALDLAARRSGARVLYCMPSLHNPTTATMSQARREAIADVVDSCGLSVIEDDVHGLLADEAAPPLAARIASRAFYIASTSKLLAGGLRVAFLAAPADRIEQLTFAVTASLWALPALNVEVAARWIADGTAAEVAARKQREAAVRQNLARELLPAGRYRSAPRSYFLWLELPAPWRADRFVRAARERGVAVAPSEAFTVGDAAPPAAVRVSLSAARDHRELADGLQMLAGLLERGPVPEPAIV
ncbi:MAG: PLP-dependent aminotransferase family protein [Candidatus Krumholzibacteria bacterium]|jgi:DNA-binding transcriptional MocR family regulator|nr:PLP-dependent aminotransferase family protein [Candidatus Krumholzibacteria bacterium]